MPAILVAGETLVDFLPDRREPLAEVQSFTRRAGGAPANVAVALALLDQPAWFWTRLGADAFGDFLAETLTDHAVPDRFIERDPDARTSLAFVSLDEAADRAFTFYRDGTADTRMTSGSVPTAVLAAVEWIVVGGVGFATDPSRSAHFDLLERARDQDCIIAVDPNARPGLWTAYDFGDTMRSVFDLAHLVKATPADLHEVGFQGGPTAQMTAVTDHGPHTVLLTRGREGAGAIATATAPWGPATADHGGFDVVPQDTTGAGDAFTAGAIAALATGEPLAEALEFANAVAALATTGTGAMEALPDRSTVTAFRDGRYRDSTP